MIKRIKYLPLIPYYVGLLLFVSTTSA